MARVLLLVGAVVAVLGLLTSQTLLWLGVVLLVIGTVLYALERRP